MGGGMRGKGERRKRKSLIGFAPLPLLALMSRL